MGDLNSVTDCTSAYSRLAKNRKHLTFGPGKFITLNFAKQESSDENDERGTDGDDDRVRHGPAKVAESASAEYTGSIISEKFKTIRLGSKPEDGGMWGSRPASSRSVLHFPQKPLLEANAACAPKTKTEVSFIAPSMKSKTIPHTGENSTFDLRTKNLAKQEFQTQEDTLMDNTSADKTLQPVPEKKTFRWINTEWLRSKFHGTLLRPENATANAQKQSYMISFWVIWVWSVWCLVCMASMLCFIPWLDEASLWFPHFRLYLEKSSYVTWIDFFDEFLKVISYFATDLRGFSRQNYDPNIEFISNSAYSFDYSSWCRDIPMTASTTCYSGRGMDVISGIITDLGVQIGVAGRMENPIQFGTNFAATFRSTVHDIDKIYKEIVLSAYQSAETSTLDISKLELVHKAALSIKLGDFVWPMKVAHASCMCVFSSSLMFLLFTKRKPSMWVKIGTATFLVLCEAITFSTYTLETIYLSELNHAAHLYDVTLTSGLGSTLMIVEFLLGIFLGALYIVN